MRGGQGQKFKATSPRLYVTSQLGTKGSIGIQEGSIQ
jgi:hypothetical protein